MSDEYAKQVKQESQTPNATANGRSVTLSVTMHPNGQIEFSLPSNFVLAFGLLGMASSKLTSLQMQAEFKATQAARGGLDGLVRKMTGG